MSDAWVRAFRRWPRLLVGALLTLMLAAAAGAEPPLLRLDRAEFAADGSPGAVPSWRSVDLPHSWRELAERPAQARYRWRFALPAAARPAPAGIDGVPTRPGAGGVPLLWALRAERLGSHHRLWLNGQLLDDTWARIDSAQPRAMPLLLTLPPALLRDGENRLELEVLGGLRAGQSALELGPAPLVERRHLRQLQLTVDLPQQLNVAAGGACLFALLLWLRRRSEAAMGWFGLLGLLLSLRNYAYYEVGSALPPLVGNLLFLVAQVASNLLLGLFAMALTRRRPPGYRPALLTVAAVVVLAGVAALGHGVAAIDRVRALAYPVLGLLMLPALWLIGQRVRQMRGGELAALLAALGAVVVAALHDYRFQQGLTTVNDNWWLPYATPWLVLAFAALMVGRFVAAMDQVEVLNRGLEQRVQERTRALAAANAAKSRFLAAASHDLRQPLVTIGLLVGLLREQVAQPALRAMVAKVDEAVAAMESLLAGLLDLSRLDAGSTRLRVEPVALQPLFDAVGAHQAEAARRRGLTLTLQPSALAVQADALLLERILRNLVDNALRYTDAGGVRVRARAGRDGRVRLQVWDSGRGIARAQRAAVFEEFVQIDNPQRDRSQGLGLGLAIVQRSAALLGAPLRLRSRPGRGSCFSLSLPAAAAPGPVAAPLPVAERWLAGRRLLLVEDDGAVRDALVERLRAWGAEVEACDGPRALRVRLDAAPPPDVPDLALTDWRLPGGSGADVAELLRRRCGRTLPVLVLTGSTAPAELDELAASGLPVLHKPFRVEQLRAALQAALGA